MASRGGDKDASVGPGLGEIGSYIPWEGDMGGQIERELDPNRERLGSNLGSSIKATALPAHSTLQFHCVLSAKKKPWLN